jgi:hypothetical protein
MASPQLSNYLRAHRKRIALSQDEVAFLMGDGNGAKVCQHECFVREPSLRAILAYEAIYQKPGRDLFVGLYVKIEQEVTSRAATLLSQIEGCKSNQRIQRKRRALANLMVSKPEMLAA